MKKLKKLKSDNKESNFNRELPVEEFDCLKLAVIKQGLENIKNVDNRDFDYTVMQNILIIEDSLKGWAPQEKKLNELLAPFHKEGNELKDEYKELCILDPENKINLVKDYQNKSNLLKIKYKKELKRYAKEYGELTDAMQAKVISVRLVKIKKHEVPSNLKSEYMLAVFPLIKK